MSVAVHLGVKMADTLSFTAKVDMVVSEYNLTTRDPDVSQKLTKQNEKWYSPSQVWPQIMCHTHSWPQQCLSHKLQCLSTLKRKQTPAQVSLLICEIMEWGVLSQNDKQTHLYGCQNKCATPTLSTEFSLQDKNQNQTNGKSFHVVSKLKSSIGIHPDLLSKIWKAPQIPGCWKWREVNKVGPVSSIATSKQLQKC